MDIEMGMIRGKLELQTELLDRTMGQSKMRAGQLAKEGKVLELQRQQADIQIMLDELERKKLTKDSAQVVLETEKLNNINAKIRKAKMEASALHQVQQAFRDSFEASMATAFQSIIEGTSNMKDAFLSMTKSILSAIAQILAKQAAIAIMGMIPGMPGIPIGGPGSREGGIMKFSWVSFIWRRRSSRWTRLWVCSNTSWDRSSRTTSKRKKYTSRNVRRNRWKQCNRKCKYVNWRIF